MAKTVDIRPPPNGYGFVKIGKGEPLPHGGLPAVDAHGAPVKRCYYVPRAATTAAPPAQAQRTTVAAEIHHGHSSGGFSNVLGGNYAFNQKRVFEFKENAFGMSGASARVLDMNSKQELFKIKSAMTGMNMIRGGQRQIFDMQTGREACQVGRSQQAPDGKKLLMKLAGIAKASRHIYNLQGQSVAKIGENMYQMGAGCTMEMNDGRKIDVEAPGWRAKQWIARHNNQKLFEIQHKTSAKSVMTGSDDYHIFVEPNVDCLFAIATCLILEDLFRPEGGGGGLMG